MKSKLKTAVYLCTLLSVTLGPTACFAQASPSAQNWENSPQNWENNPNNWKNSPQNYENSPQNWKNSPLNYENSASNYNNANGIYDSSGNRTGYKVPRGDGGVNFFNNDGSLRGYQPGR